MEKAKVYFTDMRTGYGGLSLPGKLAKLIKAAGIGNIDFNKKFAAIKIHFGEPGNVSYLRPNGGRCEGAWRHAVFDGLQHFVRWPPQTRAGTYHYRLRKWLQPLFHWLPRYYCRRLKGHGRGVCARA